MWKDPEYRAKMTAQNQKNAILGGRPPAKPNGMREKDFQIAKAIATENTKKVMDYMARDTKFEPDNELAHKALETAVNLMQMPGNAGVKLQAAKMILEFVQKKPVVANAVTVQTAESFLDQIIEGETVKEIEEVVDDTATDSDS